MRYNEQQWRSGEKGTPCKERGERRRNWATGSESNLHGKGPSNRTTKARFNRWGGRVGWEGRDTTRGNVPGVDSGVRRRIHVTARQRVYLPPWCGISRPSRWRIASWTVFVQLLFCPTLNPRSLQFRCEVTFICVFYRNVSSCLYKNQEG